MIAALVAVEVVSVFIMLTRWSWKYNRGDYNVGSDEEIEMFFASLLAGLVPLIALAFVAGEMLHQREIGRAAAAKRLAAEEREVERLLREKR